MKMKSMKNLMAGVGGVSALVLVGAGVFGVPAANAQIANTKHNLGTSAGPAGRNQFSGTGEICVFCHTPHGSDTSAAVPLWNRTMSSPTIYKTYNSLGTSSLDGTVAAVGSVSLACLSCHDGTQAMNAVINASGSGTTGDSAWTSGTWNNSITEGKLSSTAITNLSKDLTNDHPIGIQYAGGPKTTIPVAGTEYNSFKDADFKKAQSTALNGMTVWWVDTGTAGQNSREKTDMQLYTRTITETVNNVTTSRYEPYVECASCHDPHTAANPTFLRISNTGSAVCLACHSK